MGQKITIDQGKIDNGIAVYVTAEGASGKTVAVTGANGFIGSHVVKLLLEKGYKVRGTVQNLDLAAVQFLKLLPKAAENLSLFKGELLHEGCFDNVFKDCDCVFHLASPTWKDQREMKHPETEMIEQARGGTLNVLRSAEKARVNSVVITSSMCAATPVPDRPRTISESNWADPDVQKKKGAWYPASKTLAERAAVEFVAMMNHESAIRLVRICPAFTVGPMLQPTENSSMERFAAICAGTHHKRIPNRSQSLIDVRDTAAHHVAAYEKGLEGRFFSLTEAWPWTMIYQALKYHLHQMKLPESLPPGTSLRPINQYNTTRMKLLGVRERGMMQVLGEAVKSLVNNSDYILLTSPFLPYAGYYNIGTDGSFFMIDVRYNFNPDVVVVFTTAISYKLTGETNVTVLNEPPSSTFEGNNFVWRTRGINLEFKRGTTDGSARVSVTGTIKGQSVEGSSYITHIPPQTFADTYSTADTETTTIDIKVMNSTITDYKGESVQTFGYDPVKRQFYFNGSDGYLSRLYMNAATDTLGCGVRINFVRFDPKDPANTGSTKIFYTNLKPSVVYNDPPVGANELAAYVGYYPLNSTGSFVSIVENTNQENPVLVAVCTDDKNSTEYASFTFENGTVTFPDNSPDLQLTLLTADPVYSTVSVQGTGFQDVSNYFEPVSILVFASEVLTGVSSPGGDGLSLTISPTEDEDAQPEILYAMTDGTVILKSTTYEWNSVVQMATQTVTEESKKVTYAFNFCFNANEGVTCGVTTNEPDFEAVLYANPPQ